jgi:hypothetical protein
MFFIDSISYLSSELSGDAELPPGELHDFFNSSDATRLHAATLQDVSEKVFTPPVTLPAC